MVNVIYTILWATCGFVLMGFHVKYIFSKSKLAADDCCTAVYIAVVGMIMGPLSLLIVFPLTFILYDDLMIWKYGWGFCRGATTKKK